MNDTAERKVCLFRAADGFCANCKAKRYRHDVLNLQNEYDHCLPERDYPSCEFFKEKPVIPPKT